MDNTTIRRCGRVLRTCLIRSRPLRPGIIRSTIRTSGLTRWTSSRPVIPSSASATTWKEGSVCRRFRSPCRTIGWSSTKATFTNILPPFQAILANRKSSNHLSPLLQHRPYQEITTGKLGTLSHPAQAGAGFFHHGRRIEPASLINHLHPERVLLDCQAHKDGFHPGMPCHVRQGFLNNSVGGCLYICRKAAEDLIAIKINANAHLAGESFKMPFQSRDQ